MSERGDRLGSKASTVSEYAVEFRDVSFAYDGEAVLRDASFRVEPGSFVSILGPNGGGKTTLAKLMLGLLSPQRGTIRVFGKRPAVGRHNIGYVPQYSTYDPQFPVTVLDVVLMGTLSPLVSFHTKRDRARALSALEEVGLSEAASRAFADLSGGERQRVLIARALAVDPAILLLDEPTANVDVALESRLSSLLRYLNKRLTVMLITHDLGFVSSDVHQVLCVNEQVRIHPTESVTPEMISQLYGGSVRMVRHDRSAEENGNGPVFRPQFGAADARSTTSSAKLGE
jgi:zinc transport system ATP-binding protein